MHFRDQLIPASLKLVDQLRHFVRRRYFRDQLIPASLKPLVHAPCVPGLRHFRDQLIPASLKLTILDSNGPDDVISGIS